MPGACAKADVSRYVASQHPVQHGHAQVAGADAAVQQQATKQKRVIVVTICAGQASVNRELMSRQPRAGSRRFPHSVLRELTSNAPTNNPKRKFDDAVSVRCAIRTASGM